MRGRTGSQRFLRESSVPEIVARLHDVFRSFPGWIPLRLVVGADAWRHFRLRRAVRELGLPSMEREPVTFGRDCPWHVDLVFGGDPAGDCAGYFKVVELMEIDPSGQVDADAST
jgi:hypothetical protein